MTSMPFDDISSGRRDSHFRRAKLKVAGLLDHLLPPPRSRLIFIIGTGRSGTHWLGWTMERHPELVVTIERPEIFSRVTEMAIWPDREPRLMPDLIRRYQAERRLAAPLHYVDKSHPNIWLVDSLATAFPEARFIGMRRDPRATVASMLKKPEVRRWVETWQNFPIPNRFLGITTELAPHYGSLSVAARCALRWRAHTDQLDLLARKWPDLVMILDYEALQADPEGEMLRLQQFLGLEQPLVVPEVKQESLKKWESQLSAEEVEAILEVAEGRLALAGC